LPKSKVGGHEGEAGRGVTCRKAVSAAAISNPKVLLFYGAFLPQFIAVDRPLLIQFIIMALTFGLVEFVVEALLARIAHRIRPWLNSVGKRFNHICGGVFIAIGLALPLTR